MDAPVRQRGVLLYSVLAGLLHEKGKQVLKSVEPQNGYEGYRRLRADLEPSSRTRILALLQTLNAWPSFDARQGIMPQVMKLESAVKEYEQLSGTAMDPNLKLATLLRCLTGQLRQHTNLIVSDSSSYTDVRNLIMRWDSSQTKWHQPLLKSFEINSPADHNDPMDIDRVYGKGHGKKGKGKHEKGKSKFAGAKGRGNKGKSKSDSKGYGNKGKTGKGKQFSSYSGKGYGDPQREQQQKRADQNACLYCGKHGHWKRECWQFQQDKQSGTIRRTDEQPLQQSDFQTAAEPPRNVPSGSQTPSVQSGATFKTASSVRRVSVAPAFSIADDLRPFDVHIYSMEEFDSETGSVCMITACGGEPVMSESIRSCVDLCECIGSVFSRNSFHDYDVFPICDMSATDDDGHWTYSCNECGTSDCAICSKLACEPSAGVPQDDACSYIRMLYDSDCSGDMEIILDSGADISVLPLGWEGCGTESSLPAVMFRDAQGRKIEMSGCRDAHVLLGDVSFTETFAVGPVTAPLLAMGKLVKAGWSLELSGSEPALVKGDCRIDVHYRRNSLCAYGSIRAISAESKRDDLELHVRRAVLSDALAAVGEVWNQTADDIFAIRSFGDAFLNFEECLRGVGCRFRTTIIYDDGDWQLVEFGQDISELQTPAGPIPAIEGVVDILTLAHRRRFKPEQMGFEAIFDEPAPQNKSSSSSSQSDSSSESSKGRSPARAANDEEKQQHVPAVLPGSASDVKEPAPKPSDPEQLEVEGILLTPSSTLKELRAACLALGIGKSGGKATVFSRIAAHQRKMQLSEYVHPILDDGAPLSALMDSGQLFGADSPVKAASPADEAGSEPVSEDPGGENGGQPAEMMDQDQAGSSDVRGEAHDLPADPEDERPPKMARVEPQKKARASAPGGLASPPVFAAALRIIADGSIMRVVGGEQLEHVDEVLTGEFTEAEAMALEEYLDTECRIDADDHFAEQWIHSEDASIADAVAVHERMEMNFPGKLNGLNPDDLYYPGSVEEPQLDEDTLAALDALAERVEVARLAAKGVLREVTGTEEQSAMRETHRSLNARFVHTWRSKVVGDQSKWLRRARLVAKEFAHLDPERGGLFAPSSSAIVSRVVPSLFMHFKKSKCWTMGSMDVHDAYLTCQQIHPTLITIRVGDETLTFDMLKCVPGQRDGAVIWFDSFTGYLESRTKASSCGEIPAFYRIQDIDGTPGFMVLLIHVDDVLYAGSKQHCDAFERIVQEQYDVSIERLHEVGDQITFLKRQHILWHDNVLLLQPPLKHFSKLIEIVGCDIAVHRPRKTPLPVGKLPTEVDHTLFGGTASKCLSFWCWFAFVFVCRCDRSTIWYSCAQSVHVCAIEGSMEVACAYDIVPLGCQRTCAGF